MIRHYFKRQLRIQGRDRRLFFLSLGPEFANIAPGKAANAGGVAVSGLEMAQNSQRLKWTAEEVDAKLKGIMEACFVNCLETAIA